MNIYYFEVCSGYYLSQILNGGNIRYSLNEDDRLWFDERQSKQIEKLLKKLEIKYRIREDKEFIILLKELLAKNVIDNEYLEECYKCYYD